MITRKALTILLILCACNSTKVLAGGTSGSNGSFFNNIKEKVSDFSSDAKDKILDFSHTAKDKISGISDNVKEFISGKDESGRTPEEDTDSPFFQNIWREFSEVSNKAIELAVGKNPHEKTAFEFVTLQEPKYVRLLKEAQEILANSEASGQFEDIEKLRKKNKEINTQITELRRKRISAPDSSYNPLADTKKSIDKKLESLPKEIMENEEAIDKLKADILNILNKHGINITQEELNYFIISAEGSELVKLITVAENMKRIQKIIEQELQKDKNNVELARIYTGMYLVSLDAYATAHDSVINNIHKYRSRLADIKKEAYDNHEEAKRLKASVSSQDAANVDSNIRINERTMEVANMYDSLLNRRTNNLKESRSNITKKVDVARNTYKTIVNGVSLINLVNDGSGEYALLINFEMPELKSIYDDAVMSTFADISEKIKMEK